MCLFSVRPEWENDVEFANRVPRNRKVTYVARPASRRVSETIIRESTERPAQYVQAPRTSAPIIRVGSAPRIIETEPPPRPTSRIELVSVEETRSSSPRTSRVSVSGGKGKSRKGSSRGGDEEVYIEREREMTRLAPAPQDYDTYRYVEAPKEQRYIEENNMERRRSRSITYETNPRHSGRLVERERVVVEDGGRRREYYRRP